jgi:hypothetical protein
LFSLFNEICVKNERNEKFKKRDYSRRTINKKSVYNLLFSRSVHREGMTVKEIRSELKFLTERTISNIINELLTEDKVFKSRRDNKYYVKSLFIDNGWSVFAEYLRSIQKQNDLNKIPLRKIYSHGHTFHDELENEIFNFGNMIGAFITYILIESLRPNERATALDRYDILIKFLQNAVDLNSIFLQFVKILPQDSTNQLIMGLNNKLLEKIIDAYNNVYPGFSELLDYGFRKYISFDWSKSKSCDHEWRKVNIHKIGERFECRKCLGVVEEQDLEPSIS